MSEYQYYEFQAIDRPLDVAELEEVQACSSRATVTPTRFVNEYSYGDFRGDASKWMEKYFDIHLYLANWGTRQLMLRLPENILEPEVARLYCAGESVTLRRRCGRVIIELRSDDEDDSGWIGDEEGSTWMNSVLPLRADLAGGDLRTLYLSWLLCAQMEELDDDAVEPPVPSGLRRLSAPLQAFADFLRIDNDLIAAAADEGCRSGRRREMTCKWRQSHAPPEAAVLAELCASGSEDGAVFPHALSGKRHTGVRQICGGMAGNVRRAWSETYCVNTNSGINRLCG